MMPIQTVLFDLDGTLLPMELDTFAKAYFEKLAANLAAVGYEPKTLMKTISAGIAAMAKNNGANTNETVFWRVFAAQYGQESVLKDKPLFERFYQEDFQSLQAVCGFQPAAAPLLHTLKRRGVRLVLATNPVFPAIATESRIRWAGLQPADFEWYTTFENSHFCKPNPAYYDEIIKTRQLDPSACLMVGNDVDEDMVAAACGMHTFLLTDCLINKTGCDIDRYPHGSFSRLSEYLDGMTA